MNKYIGYVVAISILVVSCNNKHRVNTTMSNRYKINACPSAARGYPAEMIAGSQVGSAPMHYGSYMNSSWGKSSAIISIGDGMHAIPEAVRVHFFSYIDDKFYKATYPLPQKKLKELFSGKYSDKDKVLSYHKFTVSVAPQGWVGVWLSGSAGQVEICSFRAEEANWDYKRVFPNRSVTRQEMRELYMKDMYSFVQKEIADNRTSSLYWEDLSKKYKWKLVTNDPGFEVYDYSIELINIETYLHASSADWLVESNEKAIPASLFVFVKHDKDPLRYRIWLNLVDPWDANASRSEDEVQTLRIMNRNRELMDLFDKFYTEAGDEEVSLMVELSDDMKSAQVKLKTATQEQIIEGCHLRNILDSDRVKIDD